MRPDPHRLRLVARRLRVVQTGSRLADEAIHAALGRDGYPPPYSTVQDHGDALIPPGYEMMSIYLAFPRCHAMCWLGDDRHVAQANGPTLARLSAILQAVAARAEA